MLPSRGRRDSMESRFFQRVILRHKIEALTNNGPFSGVLENISLGGVFIRTDKSLSLGDQMEINIPIHNGFGKSIFYAKVSAIRREQHGLAFKFIDLDPKNFWTLQSFIKASI